MEKYSQIIGLPVICVQTGKIFGSIKNMIFCAKQKSVVAFLIDTRQTSFDRKIVLLNDIVNLGKDALIINDISTVTNFKTIKRSNVLQKRTNILGMKVYSTSGDDLGVVKDVLFDYKTGRLEAVEVSDGILQDIAVGRNIIPLIGRINVGENSILIEQEALDEMFITGGGLKNILYSK